MKISFKINIAHGKYENLNHGLKIINIDTDLVKKKWLIWILCTTSIPI